MNMQPIQTNSPSKYPPIDQFCHLLAAQGLSLSDRKSTSGFLFTLYRISLEPGFLQGF